MGSALSVKKDNFMTKYRGGASLADRTVIHAKATGVALSALPELN